MWTGIFSKTLLVWTRIFIDTDKKSVFKNIRIHVDEALVFLSSRVWKSDSLTNRSLRYCGARSFKDLYIIVVSKDQSLGHFVGHQCFLKRGKWLYHQHTC